MEDHELEAETMKDPSPWDPLTNSALDLKILGKLLEELGEAVTAASRCVIQGIEEAHPETGKTNREWLEDELADVLANTNLASAHFNLDEERMNKRCERKMVHLSRWHQGLTRQTRD